MAEINIASLPIIPSNEFTDNDHIVLINNGKAQLLPRNTLQVWINTIAEGEKGEQGVRGNDGKDGRDGTNGVSATHRWNGTTLSITSASGTSSADLRGAKGLDGVNGANGTNGWSPIYSIVTRGNDLVFRVSGWTGGTGNQPAVGQYIGVSGLVNDINQAVNIKGLQGEQGIQGIDGAKGADGVNGLDGKDGADGTGITSVEYLADGSLRVNKTDDTSIQTGAPPKQTGWQSSKDNQYTQSLPFLLSPQVETVLPNNAGVVTSSLPSNIPTLYNPTNQKILLNDATGCYGVRVRFKVPAQTEGNNLYITFSKDTTEIPFTQDIKLDVSTRPQSFEFNPFIYGDTTLASNGLTVRVFADKAISLYDIEFVIVKLT